MLIKMPVLFCVLLVVLNHMIGPINTCAPCPLSQPPSSFRTDYDSEDATGQDGSEGGSDGEQGSNGGGSGNGGSGSGGSGGHGGGQQTQQVTTQKPDHCEKFDEKQNPKITYSAKLIESGTTAIATCENDKDILVPQDTTQCPYLKEPFNQAEASCEAGKNWAVQLDKHQCVTPTECSKMSKTLSDTLTLEYSSIECTESSGTVVAKKQSKLTISCKKSLPQDVSETDWPKYYGIFLTQQITGATALAEQIYECSGGSTWTHQTANVLKYDALVEDVVCKPVGCKLVELVGTATCNDQCEQNGKKYDYNNPTTNQAEEYIPIDQQITATCASDGSQKTATCKLITNDMIGKWEPKINKLCI